MALPNVIYNKPGFNPLACRALRNFRKILLLLFLFHVAKLIGLPLIIRHRMREPVIRVGAPQEREAPGIGFKDSSRGSVSNLISGLPQGHSSSRLNAGQCCKLNSESGRIDVGSCYGDREPVDDVTSINKMTKINSMLAQRLCLTIARWWSDVWNIWWEKALLGNQRRGSSIEDPIIEVWSSVSSQISASIYWKKLLQVPGE